MKNVGTVDRVVRVVFGLIVVSLAFIGPKSPWAYLGLLPIITGVVGFCPAYLPFGLNTCKTRPVSKQS